MTATAQCRLVLERKRWMVNMDNARHAKAFHLLVQLSIVAVATVLAYKLYVLTHQPAKPTPASAQANPAAPMVPPVPQTAKVAPAQPALDPPPAVHVPPVQAPVTPPKAAGQRITFDQFLIALNAKGSSHEASVAEMLPGHPIVVNAHGRYEITLDQNRRVIGIETPKRTGAVQNMVMMGEITGLELRPFINANGDIALRLQ